MNYLFFFWKSI